jgi:pyruvate dehydrogenase (quinone)
VVDLACRTALSRRGPAHLAFPIDYQTADASDIMRYKRNVPGHTTTAYKDPVRVPQEVELRRAAEALRGRERVAILAGQGARGAGDELERLADALGAPIIKAQLGKDCVPDDSPS